MIRKLLIFLGLAVVLGAVGGLYQLKLMADARSREVAALKATIARERDAIQVLRAEAAYLSSPAVVQTEASKFLTLRKARTDQVITNIRDIPLRLDPETPVDGDRDLIRPDVATDEAPARRPHVPGIGIAYQAAERAGQPRWVTVDKREDQR
ncbi:hypothetical protein EV659_10997 [Rhodothalassium salexigens DSM 2132]|uniref:Cell division protein FtsL n=1 Tax=Rhodothalassium salexigens DSM 2132 TaxID=1188247 RepID=A0A4R2PDT6_RHOSA|nr:hypothetical protein [Rhodothalassium salexigens]MBB4212245.1 hypothetical protein [Rhodothalassium salexigens DSM 2132]MBK1639033.1 hypothetical protein [Rhodothalassium salexigens DSM 2132]TCP32604.1 hypothetical protein EV659_10997 [Rhodothalassium salexigens DSM 2132]